MSDEERKKNAFLAFAHKISSTPVNSFEALAQGYPFFDWLAKAAPAFFADAGLKMQVEGASQNWVLRKANLSALSVDMTAYAKIALSASDDFDVSRLVDATAVAKVQEEGGAGDGGGGDISGLVALTELVFVMIVLSGNSEAISAIKGLPKEDQAVLNQSTKRTMGVHGLKPAKKGVTPQQGAATGPSGAAAALTPTAANVGAFSPQHDRSAGGSSSEVAMLQNEILQLRGELKDRQCTLHELETRLELQQKEQKETQDRYRALLEEAENQRSSAQSEKQLSQQLSKKEETIRELTSAVTDLTAKLSVMKERSSSAIDELDNAKSKIAELEGQLRAKTDEKQELHTQLTILQDRYEVNARGKKEQQEEVSSLRSEVDRLQAALAVAKSREAQSSFVADESSGIPHQSLEMEVAHLQDQLAIANNELKMLRKSAAAAMETPDKYSSTGGATSSEVMALNLSQTPEPQLAKLQLELASVEDLAAKREAELTEAKRKHESALMELERKIKSLEGHLQRSVGELEDFKERSVTLEEEITHLREAAMAAPQKTQAAEVDTAAVEAARKEMESLKKQNNELLNRITERSEATRKEQAILVSTVVRYGHRNLMLQQRQMLASAAQQGGAAQSNATLGSGAGVISALNSWLLGSPTQDLADIPGSFLTKHRRALERGLLDSLLTAPPIASSQRK